MVVLVSVWSHEHHYLFTHHMKADDRLFSNYLRSHLYAMHNSTDRSALDNKVNMADQSFDVTGDCMISKMT